MALTPLEVEPRCLKLNVILKIKLFLSNVWVSNKFLNLLFVFGVDKCQKVQMQGMAVGRAVDLSMLDGYDQLIDELEEMFDIRGQLRPRDKWEIVFTDEDGDMMLLGDDLWQ